MLIIDLLVIILAFGLPVAVLTWYLFLRLYNGGDLDRSLGRGELRPHLKAIRKQRKDKEARDTHFIHDRWMKFGGGFYGLATVWTLVVVEVADAGRLLWSFPGFAALFEDGVIRFLVAALINQIENLVTAVTWFLYWGNNGDGNLFIAPIVGYVAYLLGMRLAREDIPLDKAGIRTFLKNLTSSKDPD